MCKIYTHQNNVADFAERKLLEDNLDVFIRQNKAISILNKIIEKKEKSFSSIVSSQRPFGLPTNFKDYILNGDNSFIKIYGNKFIGYLPKNYEIPKGNNLINKWKILTPKAVGSGNSNVDWIKPIIAEPHSICTETYVVTGPFVSKEVCQNICKYINTKFFHFLLSLKKHTQDCLQKSFMFIPLQDFSKSWTDKELYAKYKLTDEEITFIESMVRPEIGV